jgi:signal transduction histidine kinase/ActR/RegA family two-component response regulator/HAMP domain-containing protein
MNLLRNMRIRRKLALITLAPTIIGVTLAILALALFARYGFRRTLVRDMTVIADVVSGTMQAALVFQDDIEAARTLNALASEPQVVAACVYNAAGNRIAEYRRRGLTIVFPKSPAPAGVLFHARELMLFRPIVLNQKQIGTIYLQADLGELRDQLQLFIAAGIFALLGSMTVAAAIASRMQRAISGPILSLARTARHITEQRDFGVRAKTTGHDEIGQLTDGFNRMLTVIEEREDALQATNLTLRDQIEQRERVEGRAHAQLARLELLHRITRAIGERQDLASIFQVVVRNLEDHLSLQFGCVALYGATEAALTISTVGLHSEDVANELGLSRQSVIPAVEVGTSRWLRGELVYVPDTSSIDAPFPQLLARAGLQSLVIAPLVVENRIFGVVMAARSGEHAFSSPECEFLRQLSEHVALASNQVQLYGALQEAYDDLRQTQQTVMQQERLRALGQMASGIAHDINNAMFPVTLYSDYLLQKEPNLSPRARNYLTTILNAAGDVAQTVNRMGEFYQRDARGSFVAISLNRIVEQAVHLTRARWYDMPMQRGIVIDTRMQLQHDIPEVSGIEGELREALTNLIFNAVDAMPQGGTLTLRTGGPLETWKPHVFLEVSDTGSGMDEATRRRCLEPFFTTKGERGTGLGLAMVYGILQRHGAEAEIDSTVGKGTTIRLLFPVPTTVAPAVTPRVAREVPPGLQLLLVDDDPVMIRSLREILESDGHDVTVATGGRDGIDTFRAAHDRSETFSAVITDLGMPYVDGRNVADAVKTISSTTPVILLTGWGHRLQAEGEVPPNVDCLISKPPRLGDVRDALAQVLAKGA